MVSAGDKPRPACCGDDPSSCQALARLENNAIILSTEKEGPLSRLFFLLFVGNFVLTKLLVVK